MLPCMKSVAWKLVKCLQCNAFPTLTLPYSFTNPLIKWGGQPVFAFPTHVLHSNPAGVHLPRLSCGDRSRRIRGLQGVEALRPNWDNPQSKRSPCGCLALLWNCRRGLPFELCIYMNCKTYYCITLNLLNCSPGDSSLCDNFLLWEEEDRIREGGLWWRVRWWFCHWSLN